MTAYIDFSSCPNLIWENERRHHSGHRRVRPGYRWGYWNVGYKAFAFRPPKTMTLKSGYRFRHCKEKK